MSIWATLFIHNKNANTISHDLDGAGPKLLRSFTYDGENRSGAIP
jgi:hypothetical protein